MLRKYGLALFVLVVTRAGLETRPYKAKVNEQNFFGEYRAIRS